MTAPTIPPQQPEPERGCKGLVYRAGSFRASRCSRNSVLEGYCKQHHPQTVAARSQERNNRWRAEWDAKNAADAARKAKIARLIELSCEEARQIIAELNLR